MQNELRSAGPVSAGRLLAVCLVAGLMGGVATSVRAAEQSLSGDPVPTNDGNLVIHPINHATFAMDWKGTTVYVDPVGGAQRYSDLPKPALVLITDIHGDHLDLPTLAAVVTENTELIAPPAVAEKLPPALQKRATVLTNGAAHLLLGIRVEAVPAYNLTPDRSKFHSKGRGNGYLLTMAGTRVYISGDTEDIPEMRALKNVDVAFVCMNLPYTMTVEQAADAVRAFKPKVVYPYHYRGSDLQQFAKLVGTETGIDVRLRDWYK